MKKLIYIVAIGIGLLTSCKKEDRVEHTKYETVPVGDTKYAYIKILNLTPSSPVINYYMDGPKFSGGLSSTGIESAGYAYNGLFPDLGYAVVSPGSHKLTGKIVPAATVDPGLEVLNTQITPAAGKYYTIYTTGMYDAAKKIPSTVVIEDKKPALDTTKIYIRLVNFLNNSPNFDLAKDLATGPKLATNVAYGTASEFVSIPGIAGVGGQSPIIKLFFNDAATGIPIGTTGSSFTLSKGRAYTIYLRGVAGSTTFPTTATFYTTFY